MSSHNLTDEQRKRIEENKQRALARRQEKLSPVKQPGPPSPAAVRKPAITASSVPKIADPVHKKLEGIQQRPQEKGRVASCVSSHGLNDQNIAFSITVQGEISPPKSSNVMIKSIHTSMGSKPQMKQLLETSSDLTSSGHNFQSGDKSGIDQGYISQNSTLPKTIVSQSQIYQSSSNSVSSSSSSSVSSNNTSGSGTHNILQSSVQSSAAPQDRSSSFRGQKLNGKCVLVNNHTFSVEVGYNAALIQYFKLMKTKSYDQSTKTWSFKLEEYDTFMKGLSKFKPDINIEGLPRWILQTFSSGQKEIQTVPEADLSCVDQKLVQTLLPFQQEGVNVAIHRNGRILIADDMGLGKTLQAICIADYYRKEWPVLVVAPSSVRFAWAQQVCRWLPSIAPTEVNVVEKGSDRATIGLVNIISYDLLSKKATELKQAGFKVIIMDESHFLKNSKTMRTRAAMPLLRTAKRVLLLSGTPALSRPNELYCQIVSICPNLFKFHDFGLRYCSAKKMPWGWDYSGSSNMVELQLLLEKMIMIRRQKKDVLSQLPAKTRQMVVLDPRSVQKHKNLQTASQLMKGRLKGIEKRGALLQYFHETCRSKLSAVRDYVTDLLEAEKKFLVFAHHKEMLDGIEDCIQAQLTKSQYIRIDGSTSSEQRHYFCSKFQTSDAYRIAILSITAANAGLNLSAANNVVFAELFWNPGILVQAEDRAHRIGQQDSVSVQYLVAQGTADDYIWPLIQGKLDILSKAGLTKDDFSDADTKHISDTQQNIMDMFKTDFIDDTIPDRAADEEEQGPSTSSTGQLVIERLTPEVKPETPKKFDKKSTPQKHRGEMTSPGKSKRNVLSSPEKTPTKRQATITSFFPSPSKRSRQGDGHSGCDATSSDQSGNEVSLSQGSSGSNSRIASTLDDLFGFDKDDESSSGNKTPDETYPQNIKKEAAPAMTEEDLFALQTVDWDEEME